MANRDHAAGLRAPLATIVVLGFIVRLLWGLHLAGDEPSLWALPDQVEYLHIAQSVLGGHGFAFVDPRLHDVVRAYRMPGYPLFIAACDARLMIVRIVQAILDASTILATYWLARRWLDKTGALVAAGLVAVNPFLIYFSALILSETLFTAMLTWGVALIVTSGGPWPREPRKLAAWLGGGFLIALSIEVRPNAIALPLLVGLAAALIGPPLAARMATSDKSPAPRRWPVPVGATFALITLLVLIPWTWRNVGVLSQSAASQSAGATTDKNFGVTPQTVLLWDTTNEGITKYDGFNPSATGASDQRFVVSMAPQLRGLSELDRSRYFSNLADESIRQMSWTDLAELTAAKVVRTWSLIPLSEAAAGRSGTVALALVYTIPVSVLVLGGLFSKLIPLSGRLFLLLTPAYFTLIVAMSVGSLRYRIPAEPMMAILAASAVSNYVRSRGVDRRFGRLSESAPQEAAA